MKTENVFIILFAILSAGCFLASIVMYTQGLDDEGLTLIFISAIGCFLCVAIGGFFEGGYGGGIAMFVVSLFFLNIMLSSIQNRIQPVVTEQKPLSLAHPEGPFLLADSNMHCSPVSSEHTFYCYANSLNRYSRCCGCGRRFLEHYKGVMSPESWKSKVRHQNAQRDAYVYYLDY